MTSSGEFSVAIWAADGTYTYRDRWLCAEDAMRAFGSCVKSVGCRTGLVVRVIVTDGGDNTVAEWTFLDGYTFPPELVMAALARGQKARKEGPRDV